jgi:hypothetical protein
LEVHRAETRQRTGSRVPHRLASTVGRGIQDLEKAHSALQRKELFVVKARTDAAGHQELSMTVCFLASRRGRNRIT